MDETTIDKKYEKTYDERGGNYTPKDIDELALYISEQLTHPWSYDGSVYDAVRCLMATWNFLMSKQGHSGFSASIAGLEFFGMTRRMKHSFIVLDGHDVFYPQHNLVAKVQKFVYEQQHSPDMIKEAKELLEDRDMAHPDVIKRWEEIANNTPIEK
jgi:hypothetical protein